MDKKCVKNNSKRKILLKYMYVFHKKLKLRIKFISVKFAIY
jgi:hypothetical protein